MEAIVLPQGPSAEQRGLEKSQMGSEGITAKGREGRGCGLCSEEEYRSCEGGATRGGVSAASASGWTSPDSSCGQLAVSAHGGRTSLGQTGAPGLLGHAPVL
jgi:hypothetical protein